MAHEMESNDNAAYANEAAWHGLGTVVKGAMNPAAALKLAGLEWDVEESTEVCGSFADGVGCASDWKMLRRSDKKTVLGMVGKDWTPVQNSAIAELAYALAKSGSDMTPEVETAGSFRGGRRVYTTLRAPSIEIGNRGDAAVPYLFVGNGHDGTMALTVKPTNIRVVCSNTFHAALGMGRGSWTLRHSTGVTLRVEQMAEEIQRWSREVKDGAEVAASMAGIEVNREKVRNLWADVLLAIDGPMPDEDKQPRAYRNRIEALAHMAQVFDVESQQFGANLWVAANAATHYYQHNRASKGKRTADEVAYSAWDGTAERQTEQVFATALASV